MPIAAEAFRNERRETVLEIMAGPKYTMVECNVTRRGRAANRRRFETRPHDLQGKVGGIRAHPLRSVQPPRVPAIVPPEERDPGPEMRSDSARACGGAPGLRSSSRGIGSTRKIRGRSCMSFQENGVSSPRTEPTRRRAGG